jgi:DNA-binding NarL/FixJ family response regulator
MQVPLARMNILISFNPKLSIIVNKRWPKAKIDEVYDLDGVIRRIFETNYNLLILDSDMLGNEKLESFIEKAIKHNNVAIFSSKNDNGEQVKKLILRGIHAFLPKSATEEEIVNILHYILS